MELTVGIDILECQHCYAAVARDAYNGHMDWHRRQTEINELTVTNLESALRLIERMVACGGLGHNSR